MREVRHAQLRSVEPAPVVQPDEDDVTAGGGHQAGQQQRYQRGPHRQPGLDEQDSRRKRSAEQGRDRRERAGRAEHGVLARSEPHQPAGPDADGRPESDQRRLRAQHRPEGKRGYRRQRHAGRCGHRRGLRAEALDRLVPPVARQRGAHDGDDRRPDRRQRDHQEPGRRRVPEAIREVIPEDVLELMDERQEAGGEQRRRHPDRGTDQDQTQVCRPGERLWLWRQGLSTRRRRARRAPPEALSPARSRASSGSRARRTWRSPARPCRRWPGAPARIRPHRPAGACRPAPS